MKGNWEKELHLVSHGRGTCKLWHNYINGIFPTKYTENFQANYKNFTCYDWNFVFLRGIIQKKGRHRVFGVTGFCIIQLMEEILHQFIGSLSHCFARFFTSKRRLALGFLNHQQKWDSSTQTLIFSGWPEKKTDNCWGKLPPKKQQWTSFKVW